jgi:hypothetical protein
VEIENPFTLAEALALHRFPERKRMIAEVLRGKATTNRQLDARAQLVTLLRERELWPMEPR